MPTPFTARLLTRHTVADGVLDQVFELVEPNTLPFAAGQFVTLAVGKEPGTEKILRRSYSIASRSDDPARLRFLIRMVPGGAAGDFFTAMPTGTPVEMTGPHGFFVLAPSHPGDIVFAATGTGLAPVLPMLAELEQQPTTGRRLVYWGLRSLADMFVPAEVAHACASAGATLATHLSQPSAHWDGPRGHITPTVLHALPSLRSPTFYLVGNGAMIDELKKGLMAAGIDRKRQIRTESFFD